jgi:ABC-type transport system involved in multi-copper enzyme maturation permease subunit
MRSAPWIIAKNTFREIIRDRILYGLVIFAVLLIGFSLVLGELSFAEQTRISINFGLSGIHLSAVTLSIFIGSTLVAKEIEKQTILTMLVRPVSRLEFLCGKMFGLMLVNITVIVGLALVLLGVIHFLSWTWGWSFFIALYGIILECLVLLALTMLFGMITRPILAVCFTIGLFLIGHWLGDLEHFAVRSDSDMFKTFASLISTVLPDLERFNWRALVVYNDVISSEHLGIATLYGFCWTVAILIMAGLIFRRRDFV